MEFGSLEILASIMIAWAVIKLVVLFTSPESWFNFVRKLCSSPKTTSSVSLILSIIVLYYLIDSGLTIVDIFAVTLFISLLIIIGFIPYIKDLLDLFKGKDSRSVFKENWIYTLVWIVLLAWGIKVILSSLF